MALFTMLFLCMEGGLLLNLEFKELLEANPVVAAVKDDKGLKECVKNEDIKVVFVLYGDICSIESIVSKIHDSGKKAIVHIDLVSGLSAKDAAVEFMKKSVNADGIISTRPQLIKKANYFDMFTVLRVFALDSMAYENILKQVAIGNPDAIEILPGLMPKVIRKVGQQVRIPVIAGGLISDKEDVVNALSAGAVSVTSTDQKVWNM